MSYLDDISYMENSVLGDCQELYKYARQLEAMLRKHEHCVFNNMDIPSCPECGGECNENPCHSPDCELARLIE